MRGRVPLSLGLVGGFEIGRVMLLISLGFVKALANGTEDTPPLWPPCPAGMGKDELGVDNEVLDTDGWEFIDGRGVLNDGRGTPPKDGRGVLLSDGRGTPPNEGLGTPLNEGLGTPPKDGRGVLPSEGLGTPPNEDLGIPASPPLPLTLSPPPPNSTDPTLDVLE